MQEAGISDRQREIRLAILRSVEQHVGSEWAVNVPAMMAVPHLSSAVWLSAWLWQSRMSERTGTGLSILTRCE
jgi:hypothetical protein